MEQEHKSDASEKIEVNFVSVADGPLLKKRRWLVTPDKTIADLRSFLHKLMSIEPVRGVESISLFVNQSFAPTLDSTVESILKCYGIGDGKSITLYYCKTPVWG
ncbi:hypothetical protein ACOME3_003825 [Neoechinorhynchus agilis]